jgi:hypothetical protein
MMLPRIALAAVGLVFVLAVASCADHGQTTHRTSVGSPAYATVHCAVTTPNGETPPGESRSRLDFGNGRLWTALPVDGKLVVSMTSPLPPGTVFGELHRDGSMGTKFPWWGAKSAGRQLRITGRRLDGHAKPLRASVAPGLTRAPHFWATRITFATQGCWQVTGTAGTEKLTFVIQVMRGRPSTKSGPA